MSFLLAKVRVHGCRQEEFEELCFYSVRVYVGSYGVRAREGDGHIERLYKECEPGTREED